MVHGLSRKSFLAGSLAVLGQPALAAEAPLQRAIPKSGEKLTVVGLGTAVVFGNAGVEAQRAVVKALVESGGSLIDTAPTSSGNYEGAEPGTGQAAAALGLRKRCFFATKVGARTKEAGEALIEGSFKALQTDVIDLIQVHNLIEPAIQLATLRDLKAKGRIRYVGITHSDARNQDALAEWLEKEPLDFVQLNYALDVRGPEQRLLPLAADKGVAVLVNLPLGRGRLLRNLGEKPLPGWAKEVGANSWASLLLKYVISNPAVTVAIPGTKNPQHMAENVQAATGPLLTPKQRQDLIAFVEKA